MLEVIICGLKSTCHSLYISHKCHFWSTIVENLLKHVAKEHVKTCNTLVCLEKDQETVIVLQFNIVHEKRVSKHSFEQE